MDSLNNTPSAAGEPPPSGGNARVPTLPGSLAATRPGWACPWDRRKPWLKNALVEIPREFHGRGHNLYAVSGDVTALSGAQSYEYFTRDGWPDSSPRDGQVPSDVFNRPMSREERRAVVDEANERARRATRPEETRSDTGNALRFVRLLQDQLIYVPGVGWHVWDETRWRRDNSGEALELTKVVCADVRAHAEEMPEDQRGRWREWARNSESAFHRREMLRLAEVESILVVHVEQLDADPLLINYPNGTYDATRRELREHRREDRITRLRPIALVENASDPTWDKVLAELFDDDNEPHREAKLTHLRRFAGYTATGLTNEKKIMVPKGPRDTAKSTVTEAIYAALGDVADGGYATTWDAEVIEAGTKVNRNEKLHKARGARMIIVGELDKGSRMADGFVKRYSGGDTVDACGKYKDSYSYRPQGKLWMPTNYVPRSADPAVQGRLDLLPHRHVPEKIDRSIIDHLQRNESARRAVTAWQHRGLVEYLDARAAGAEYPLGDTPWLDDLIADYARDSNALLDFIDACFNYRDDDETHSSHVNFVWAAYAAWALDNVDRPLKRRTFDRALEECGHVKRRIPAKGGPTYWLGLKLKPSDELPAAVVNSLRVAWGAGCCP